MSCLPSQKGILWSAEYLSSECWFLVPGQVAVENAAVNALFLYYLPSCLDHSEWANIQIFNIWAPNIIMAWNTVVLDKNVQIIMLQIVLSI